jgi:uncharacterized protein YlxW (UPF0749 family)
MEFLHATKRKAAMKFMHTLAVVSLLAVFTVPADANNNGNNKKAMEQAKKQKAQKEKERAERKKVRDELKDYMESRDKNKDGSLSLEEFLGGESDKAKGQSTFTEFNKNKDRALSKKEIQTMLGL